MSVILTNDLQVQLEDVLDNLSPSLKSLRDAQDALLHAARKVYSDVSGVRVTDDGVLVLEWRVDVLSDRGPGGTAHAAFLWVVTVLLLLGWVFSVGAALWFGWRT